MGPAGELQLLDDLLARADLRAHLVFRGLACERWSLGGASQGRLGFHLVVSGRTWLRVQGAPAPVELTAGGMLVYRPDTSHLLADAADADSECMPAKVLPISALPGGTHVGLLCGYIEGGINCLPLLDALPACLLWPGLASYTEPLASLIRALIATALDETRAGERVLARLCELIVLTILREPRVLNPDRIALLRAQCDPALRRAFEAMRARPGRRWTLATLARQAGFSRSAFAMRFKDQAGMSAMHYLRGVRVALAERRVREDGLTVEAAARAAGFGSARAFRRAARAMRR